MTGNLRLTDLTAATALDGTEPSYIVQGGVDAQATSAQYAALARLGVIQSCCRLSKVGSNLVLSPFNGNRIFINSRLETIPDAGVSLSSAGFTPSINYFIYAYMSGATLTLEASTSSHSAQANTGVQIKTVDSSRTLVGYARPITGPAWADTLTQRFVRSWFNQQGIHGNNHFTSNRTIASTTFIEINTEIRVELLTWEQEQVNLNLNASVTGSGIGVIAAANVSVDGVTQDARVDKYINGGTPHTVSASISTNLSEGYHYITTLGATSVGTSTFSGGSLGIPRTVLSYTTAGL